MLRRHVSIGGHHGHHLPPNVTILNATKKGVPKIGSLGRSQMPPPKKMEGFTNKWYTSQSAFFQQLKKYSKKATATTIQSWFIFIFGPLALLLTQQPASVWFMCLLKKAETAPVRVAPTMITWKNSRNFTTQKKKYSNIFPRKNDHFRRQKRSS